MTIFKSDLPKITVPDKLTVWQWLFESDESSLKNHARSDLAGFFDFPTKQRIDWMQVRDFATYISSALVKKYGLQAGETVALFSRNTIWYPVMLHAAARVGGMISGASPAYGVEEMTYALKAANAKFLATSPSSIKVALQAAEQAGIPRDRIFLLEGALDGFTSIQDLIDLGKSYGSQHQVPPYQIPQGKKSHDVCAFLSFSSGTTGLPKGVMISHYNVIAQCKQMQALYDPSHRRVLAVLPFFHITGLVHVLHLPVFFNIEVIMLPSFTMESMLQAVTEHQIRELLLVPPILIRLVRDPIVDKFDLSCVRYFTGGSAPTSPEVMSLLDKKFPGTGFKQGWGMTESTSCITLHPPELSTWEYAPTVGKLVPNTELKIVKEDGTEAGVGEAGELLARGPQVTMGYLNRPDATSETFDRDGWLHTGDQGLINADGTVQITDRIKELIKVKGIGVAPAELEDVLLGHPEVEDVAVMGIADEYAGERPKAFVVPVPGGASQASEALGRRLLTHVQENKVRHKWLAEIEFIQAIPKSPSGKILRKNLREKEKLGRDKGLVVRAQERERAKL